jgi:hypothetical protein
MSNNLQIILPTDFTQKHEQLILKYLTQGRASLTLAEWQQLFVGFDVLHLAQVVTGTETLTFQQVYAVHVERPFANSYINQLLQPTDMQQQHSALRAQIARQIVNRLQQVGLRQTAVRASNFLLAYCLYFWESFAVGYAFEVEIYRDLTQSGIAFQAHDIRDSQARLSSYDLQLLGQHGDIKTSLYFLYSRRTSDLPHDFYITRFYEGNRQRTLVVMLKPFAWEQINGDTVEAALEEATRQFPAPVKVQIGHRPIVVIDYNVWKKRVAKRQQNK